MRYDVGKTDRLSVMRAQNASDFRPFRRLFLAKYGVGSGYVALRAPYAYAIALLPVGQYGLFFALLPVGQYGLFFALLPVGQYGLIFARGCTTLHPGLCSGTHSGRGWWGRSNGVRTGILGRGSKCPISNRYRRPLLPCTNNWLGASICNSFRP